MVVLKGKIFVLSGYSGTGKNTIINELKKDVTKELTYIPSYTTRDMRLHDNESQGNPYYFVSKEQFEDKIKQNDFIEYNTIHNNLYGTPIKEYKEALEHGAIIVKDIDVEGAVRMKEVFGSDVCLVFVEPPSIDELYHRLEHRGDSREQIDLRMKRIELERSYRDLFDFVIVNDNLNYAVSDLLEIICNYNSSIIEKCVDIKDIIPTQDVIATYNNKEYIKAVASNNVTGKPLVYNKNGSLFLLDGHHRLISTILKGLKTCDVLVLSRDTRRYRELDKLDASLFIKNKNLLLDLLESDQTFETY